MGIYVLALAATSRRIAPLLAAAHPPPHSVWPMPSAAKSSSFLSPEGLRADGRRANEVRRLRCRIGATRADGSAYIEQGNTKLLVCVSGPKEPKSRARAAAAAHDRAQLTCEFEALPFATGQHKLQSRGDRNSAEIAAAVRRVFEPVVQTHLYPRAHINIRISLMQDDGGVRSACINATTLALIDAGIALEDFVCSCSAGSVQGGALLLDLNAQEVNGVAEMNIGYLPRCERLSFVQLESRMPLTSVDEVIHFATEGCRQVYDTLRDTVQIRMQEQLHSRGVLST